MLTWLLLTERVCPRERDAPRAHDHDRLSFKAFWSRYAPSVPVASDESRPALRRRGDPRVSARTGRPRAALRDDPFDEHRVDGPWARNESGGRDRQGVVLLRGIHERAHFPRRGGSSGRLFDQLRYVGVDSGAPGPSAEESAVLPGMALPVEAAVPGQSDRHPRSGAETAWTGVVRKTECPARREPGPRVEPVVAGIAGEDSLVAPAPACQGLLGRR